MCRVRIQRPIFVSSTPRSENNCAIIYPCYSQIFFLIFFLTLKRQTRNMYVLCAYLLAITKIRTTRTAITIMPPAAEPTIISKKKKLKGISISLTYRKEDNLNKLSLFH